MDEKIPVENTTKMPIYVAGLMIPPGETRHFERHQVPPEFQPKPADTEPEKSADPLELIRAGSVKAILARLEDLADDELVRLGQLEEAAEKPRKSLLEAIAAEGLRRAAAKQDGQGSASSETGAPGESGGADQAQGDSSASSEKTQPGAGEQPQGGEGA